MTDLVGAAPRRGERRRPMSGAQSVRRPGSRWTGHPGGSLVTCRRPQPPGCPRSCPLPSRAVAVAADAAPTGRAGTRPTDDTPTGDTHDPRTSLLPFPASARSPPSSCSGWPRSSRPTRTCPPSSRPRAEDPSGRRWYQLAETHHLQLWVIEWPAGAGTGFHDHGGSRGAFTVVRGWLTERQVVDGDLHTRVLPQGEGRTFGASHLHDVRNDTEEIALSVHAYSPRLDQVTSCGSSTAGSSH